MPFCALRTLDDSQVPDLLLCQESSIVPSSDRMDCPCSDNLSDRLPLVRRPAVLPNLLYVSMIRKLGNIR